MSGSDNIPPESAQPICANLDASLVVLSVNKAWSRLTKAAPEEIIGQALTSLLEDSSELGMLANIKEHPTRINALPVALAVKGKAKPIAVSLTIHPFYSAENLAPSGFLAVATPVPGENPMANMGGVWLEPSEFIGHLVRGVAHKLNNLVTVFQGYTDMLLCGEPDRDEVREGLTQMSTASENLVEIVNRLLDVGGRASLDCRVVDGTELTENLERVMAPFKSEGIRIKTSIARELPYVKVDPKRIEQALAELIRNASDAMNGYGNMTLKFSSENNSLVIAIRDSGPGLSPDEREKIFRPFFSTKKMAGRLGIGLNAVTGLLFQMGGELQVTSEPGEGCEFRMVIPRVEASS